MLKTLKQSFPLKTIKSTSAFQEKKGKPHWEQLAGSGTYRGLPVIKQFASW